MGEIPDHIKIAEGGLGLSDEEEGGMFMGGDSDDDDENPDEEKKEIDIDNI